MRSFLVQSPRKDGYKAEAERLAFARKKKVSFCVVIKVHLNDQKPQGLPQSAGRAGSQERCGFQKSRESPNRSLNEGGQK